MESTRLSKIERLLQKELSDIFQKQTQACLLYTSPSPRD